MHIRAASSIEDSKEIDDMDGNGKQKQYPKGKQGLGQVELSELQRRYIAGERDLVVPKM